MKREISIAFQTDKSAADYVTLAKLVDQFAFDAVTVFCDAPYQPSFGPLLLMASHIHRARIGPAAVSPFRMHPIDIAANTALLADLAPGRVYLGLARGAWLADHGISEPRKPIQGIREAAHLIRALLAGESAGLDGQVFQVAPHVRAPYPLPKAKIPLLIGTWGPALAALAGEIADEVKVGGSANPEMVAIVQGYLRKGEQKAGRSENSVGVVIGAVTIVDEDRQRARRVAKKSVAMYLPVVAKLDPTVAVDPELLARIQSALEGGDSSVAGRLIPDELLEKFAFTGTPADLIEQTERLFAAGARRVEFGPPHGLDSALGIHLLGEKVLPVLKPV